MSQSYTDTSWSDCRLFGHRDDGGILTQITSKFEAASDVRQQLLEYKSEDGRMLHSMMQPLDQLPTGMGI